MRRRTRFLVGLVALVAVVGSGAGTAAPKLTLATDPIAEARADASSIQSQIGRQRAELEALKDRSALLTNQLDVARAALAEVTAEYEHVRGLLFQVRGEIAVIRDRLDRLNAHIELVSAQLARVGARIAYQTAELEAREALLEDHLRAAYERSQTSILEVLLSANSLDEATTEVGYLLTVSDQDKALADEIRVIREELTIRRETLEAGRAALAEAQAAARQEAHRLEQRRTELKELRHETARLRAAARQKKREQAAALNAALEAQGDVRAKIAESKRAFDAANALVTQLVAEQKALEEARRRAAEEARRRAAEEARREAQEISARGFRWPEIGFHVTQEWGPTSFVLEPPYTYRGTYYPHFHAGIDIATGCGTPIIAAGTGVVVASGQPLWPFDTGYGVVIDHGGGVQTWYWHITTQVIVSPGQPVTIGQLIGYEGTTGNSTGCHLHFAVSDQGVWENPRNYLP